MLAIYHPKPTICCQYLNCVSSGAPFLEVIIEKQSAKHMGPAQLVRYTASCLKETRHLGQEENLTWRCQVREVLRLHFCAIFFFPFSLLNSQAVGNFMPP